MAKGYQAQDVLVALAVILILLLIGFFIIGYLQSSQGQLSDERQFSELCPAWVSQRCDQGSMQKIKNEKTGVTFAELCQKLEGGDLERCKNRCLGCPK